MSTVYGRQLANAIARIKARGMVVNYIQVADAFVPNDSSQPWKVGVPVGTDPNARKAPVQVSIVFTDAKARGSSTQGMVSELVNRTDVPAGNKLGLMAGGQGIDVKIGDIIDRNVAPVTGLPLYKVVKYKDLSPDGTALLYSLELEL